MKKNLKRVTITGADNGTRISELVRLSKRYPFVEWGILVTKKHEGAPRYPSRDWIDAFSASATANGLQVSTHVCGRWVRELLTGELDWKELPSVIDICQRVQINTHGAPHISTKNMIRTLAERSDKEFIFQFDNINDHLPFAMNAFGLKVSALNDTSSGAGVLPKDWIGPTKDFWCGYAGGLGPKNVVEQVEKINKICYQPYWIDMETRVRTDDDLNLDLEKTEEVLQLMEPYVG